MTLEPTIRAFQNALPVCHITPSHKTPFPSSVVHEPQQSPQNPKPTMPPRARDDDLTSSLKAGIKGVVAYALCSVIMLVSDLDKVDEFLNGTALQKALAAYFLLIILSLFAFIAFNLIMAVYYLPPRFSRPRIIMTVLCFLCLFGAIYYGDLSST